MRYSVVVRHVPVDEIPPRQYFTGRGEHLSRREWSKLVSDVFTLDKGIALEIMVPNGAVDTRSLSSRLQAAAKRQRGAIRVAIRGDRVFVWWTQQPGKIRMAGNLTAAGFAR